MKGLICDPADFVISDTKTKNVLRATTSKGTFEISCTRIGIFVTDASGDPIGQTYDKSERGLQTLKRKVKETYGLWNERVVWKIFPVS